MQAGRGRHRGAPLNRRGSGQGRRCGRASTSSPVAVALRRRRRRSVGTHTSWRGWRAWPDRLTCVLLNPCTFIQCVVNQRLTRHTMGICSIVRHCSPARVRPRSPKFELPRRPVWMDNYLQPYGPRATNRPKRRFRTNFLRKLWTYYFLFPRCFHRRFA